MEREEVASVRPCMLDVKGLAHVSRGMADQVTQDMWRWRVSLGSVKGKEKNKNNISFFFPLLFFFPL